MGKNKGGRPKWEPTEDTLKLIETYAARFLREEQIAVLIGIGASTFIEKKKEFPEIVEAIKKGRAKVAVNISNKLYEAAMKGNIAALIFLGKSVVGLKENDPQTTESFIFHVHTSKGTETVQFSKS